MKNDEPSTTPPTVKVSTLTELLDSYATIGGNNLHLFLGIHTLSSSMFYCRFLLPISTSIL
jgi:hypothetical protein